MAFIFLPISHVVSLSHCFFESSWITSLEILNCYHKKAQETLAVVHLVWEFFHCDNSMSVVEFSHVTWFNNYRKPFLVCGLVVVTTVFTLRANGCERVLLAIGYCCSRLYVRVRECVLKCK